MEKTQLAMKVDWRSNHRYTFPSIQKLKNVLIVSSMSYTAKKVEFHDKSVSNYSNILKLSVNNGGMFHTIC